MIELYLMNWYRYYLLGSRISNMYKRVLFGNDTCHRASAIIKACRSAKVKTGVVQHGVIADVDKYLPNSDIMYVWGKRDFEKLISVGISFERIKIAGYPYDDLIEKKPVKNGGNILFVSTPFSDINIYKSVMNVFV